MSKKMLQFQTSRIINIIPLSPTMASSFVAGKLNITAQIKKITPAKSINKIKELKTYCSII
ncbi:MAG: hypothetical protein ACYCTB_01490 [bacterium]